ncbi:methyltransferase domain-containing protein [Bordetella genomosp. 5]|nr:methyltransferase domain-containing protein [Bordetella genomosp. 5]
MPSITNGAAFATLITMLNTAPQSPNAIASAKRLDYTLSPGHLRASAHLYGIATTPLDTARVLEIGCAAAENLLPLAQAYPRATVQGVDTNPEAIERGRRHAELLGLDNLSLQALQFEELLDWQTGVGPFDYILVRGLFSALGNDAQTALLMWCRSVLAPAGVVFVDYATNPGAKAAEIVRDAIMLHAHDATTEDEVKASARAALTLFQSGISGTNPLGPALDQSSKAFASELADDAGAPSPYLLGSNACYLVEFTDRAQQAGLAYVGDGLPLTELPQHYGQNVALSQSLMALGRPKVMRQQYLDFAIGRASRRSLLVHEDRTADIQSKPDVERLRELRWATGLMRASVNYAVKGVMYLGNAGQVLNTSDPLTIALVDTLAHAWPASLSYEALARALEHGMTDRPGTYSQDALDKALQTLLFQNLLYYALEAGPYDQPDDAPLELVTGICHNFSALTHNVITQFNLWHETLAWNPPNVEKKIIKQIATGTPLGAISDELWELNGKTDKTQGVTFAGAAATALASLKRYGGLRSGNGTWLALLRNGLSEADHAGPFWHHYIDALTRQALNHGYAFVTEPATTGTTSPALAAATRKLADQANSEGYASAIADTRKLLAKHPNHYQGWEILVYSLCRSGYIEEALKAALRLLDLAPMRQLSYARLGECLTTAGRVIEALAAGRRCLELDPTNAVSHLTLGDALAAAGRYSEAEHACRRALEIKPTLQAARTNLVNILAQRGDAVAAEQAAKDGLEVFPKLATLHNNRLFAANYAPEKSAEEIFEAYREFEKALCEPLYTLWRPFRNTRTPGRKLKVGYVSPDFRLHSGNEFIEPLLSNHDRSQFELYAYAEVKTEDVVTRRFKGYFDHWVGIRGVGADALTEQIRKDGIDILIDLAGHTGHNRLSVFARKPAPVSITWLGFGYTTGIKAIDYILTDGVMAPAGSEHLFAERPWRLEHGSLVYQAKPGMGHVSELPALNNERITLGSLSRSIRINARTVRVWSEIMRRIPNAQLVLDSGSFGEPQLQQEMAARFMAQGIAGDRLLIGKNSPPWNVLRKMDIGLDCFPHNSGVTLVETLYMGVPYVTLADRPSVGRIGSSLLHSAGHPEWVANTEDEYIEKVVALASDLPALAEIRGKLRGELEASPLMDGKGFTRRVEAAFQDMFKTWCESSQ